MSIICSAVISRSGWRSRRFWELSSGRRSRSFCGRLERATQIRFANPVLLFFLPLGGLGIGLMYHYFGRSVEGGNNLILDQIHEPNGGVPVRMAPLVLIGTVLTHLFGGSAGREGTAVQMGGSLAAGFGTPAAAFEP